jgi:hypothetical protein
MRYSRGMPSESQRTKAWKDWLHTNFGMEQGTASKFIRIAENVVIGEFSKAEDTKRDHYSPGNIVLPAEWTILYELSRVAGRCATARYRDGHGTAVNVQERGEGPSSRDQFRCGQEGEARRHRQRPAGVRATDRCRYYLPGVFGRHPWQLGRHFTGQLNGIRHDQQAEVQDQDNRRNRFIPDLNSDAGHIP